MFLEMSDFDVLHLLKLPKNVWSSTEQQYLAVNGLHGCEDSFIASEIVVQQVFVWYGVVGVFAL